MAQDTITGKDVITIRGIEIDLNKLSNINSPVLRNAIKGLFIRPVTEQKKHYTKNLYKDYNDWKEYHDYKDSYEEYHEYHYQDWHEYKDYSECRFLHWADSSY